MSKEIERKFLVTGAFKKLATKRYNIRQAYLLADLERTIRVRITNDKAFLTIKGPSDHSGLSRYEWEKEIPIIEAEELMKLTNGGMIEKTRYIISESGGLFYEVDEFHNDNDGLVMAEIELSHENQKIVKPDWLGDEVTGDVRYFNSYLSQNSYKDW